MGFQPRLGLIGAALGSALSPLAAGTALLAYPMTRPGTEEFFFANQALAKFLLLIRQTRLDLIFFKLDTHVRTCREQAALPQWKLLNHDIWDNWDETNSNVVRLRLRQP